MEEEKLTNILAGISGEYFVAAELSRRGYIATLTLKNTKGVDILASDKDAKKTIAIQVKTTKGKKNEWLLSEKSESFVSSNHYYIFVRLNNLGDAPSFFIVPSKDVAKHVIKSHKDWLNSFAKDGSPHKDGPMRKFRDYKDEFKDRWDLLK